MSNRYVALLYEQPPLFLPPIFSHHMHGARLHFNLPMFVRDYGLRGPVSHCLRRGYSCTIEAEPSHYSLSFAGRRPILQDLLGRKACARRHCSCAAQTDPGCDKSAIKSSPCRRHRLSSRPSIWRKFVMQSADLNAIQSAVLYH
jgi:hypothetical protein